VSDVAIDSVDQQEYLRRQRRSFNLVANLITAFTFPMVFLFYLHQGRSATGSLALASCVLVLRGFLDLVYRKLVPFASLYGTNSDELRAEDALNRRRIHFWSKKLRWIVIVLSLITLTWLKRGGTWGSNAEWLWSGLSLLSNPQVLMQLIILPIFFLANFLLFFGPMMMMGVSQIRGFEPGDADWGVRLEDVRGQKEAKEEIHKVITLWQSGEKFVSAGGKRERGILFLGAPGVGKTMLAKAIATGFNCPLVTIPGSGFAQTFIGMDVIIVRYMARKARKLAAKWGGQCIVFIDEIDAVGMRRGSLGGGGLGGFTKPQIPGGAMGGMYGGGMAINQLLVVMDGIDSPPFMKRVMTNKVNTWLDASYIVPRRLGDVPLRLPHAKPTGNQIYFVGATNVPLSALDPALVRPGRMGRHIHFRTPTKKDRIDILDLYLGKVAHEDSLDSSEARDELARMMEGYSPAQIEQACSLALTYAHHDGRHAFSREDLTEAMVTNEAGTALGWGYESEMEERSTAIHEAGHAVCSYLFMEDHESTRLSIRRRGETGGHHQAIGTEERTFRTRDELFSNLIWGLGAYAAEIVFYGHNTQGVGGDLGSASALAGTMVGRWGMAPILPPNLSRDDLRSMEKLGKQLLTIGNPGDIPLPPDKRRDEALLLGHAFLIAYNTILQNKNAVGEIASRMVEEKEVFGDDVMDLLKGAGLKKPEGTHQWPNL
jgi:ATP-dependent Zn protease